MTESIKRIKSIKIRLTETEHEKLLATKQGNELATWMRNICLNLEEEKQSKVDPNVLRELNRIGINMNQIARAINQNGYELVDRIFITNHLNIISEQLDEVLKKL